MKTTGWIAWAGVALMIAGCGSPAGDAPKPSPKPKETAPAAPKETEPATSKEAAPAEKKDDASAKGGNVTGALGKALLKAVSTGAKSKDQKATDEAPSFKP